MCVAVRCSALQCVAVCCSVLQCVAVCCSVLQCVAVCCSVLQCVAVCCSVLPTVSSLLNWLHHKTTELTFWSILIFYLQKLFSVWLRDCCSVLQCVAVCCSVLQCFKSDSETHTNTYVHTYTHTHVYTHACIHAYAYNFREFRFWPAEIVLSRALLRSFACRLWQKKETSNLLQHVAARCNTLQHTTYRSCSGSDITWGPCL